MAASVNMDAEVVRRPTSLPETASVAHHFRQMVVKEPWCLHCMNEQKTERLVQVS